MPKARPRAYDTAWFPKFMRIVGRVHVAVYRATGGLVGRRFHIGSAWLRGVPVCLFTTTGRKTGRRRTMPLLYMRDGDRVIVVASQAGLPGHPQWYRNLQADPHVEVQIGRERHAMRARTADDAERAELWPRLLGVYRDFDDYQRWAGDRVIPVVVCEPVRERPGAQRHRRGDAARGDGAV
ncbi:nitroreductase family deazaflavin-dependent oxidoreductase [Thermomonospora cellulosilytica]|uniref:Deazaflavin-dependent oxidoreductase (Nitroreductase family) n=1 Tax=Thermomonospora cellulosilytica TaxID=1411118 RepID=A0A7W3N2V6_9ACTN|nr:nitroreductase family deazaflavin-dependent oxidoreductase [Thermomonospora cellulosilytica]MBA9006563.1 deazaflavin-dependent oxidoreductase (nitroreductase family) [Thermomonospora cellulosilytica]